MQGQHLGRDVLLVTGLRDEAFGQRQVLPVGDHPADDVAAEDVGQDVEVGPVCKFRIWKSGCRVEALQLGTFARLERALVVYPIIAWRILHLVTWGRDCPNLPCDVVFDPEEWQAAWIVAHRARPPETPPPLGQMVRLIAGFGGFLGRKHDGHPGPKAIWEGMQKVRAFAMALEVGRAVYAGDG